MIIGRPIRALLCFASASPAAAQDSVPTVPIRSRAVASLSVPGYVDFLASDGASVWVTNEGRVELLRLGQDKPAASVQVPEPCGAMVAAFGSLWVASCRERALFRIDLQTSHHGGHSDRPC